VAKNHNGGTGTVLFGYNLSLTRIGVHIGKYASEHAESMIEGALSWKSIASLVVGLILICALLFIDWRTLLRKKKFRLKFKIWK